MDKNNKFKMAAAAMLNFIYRSQLVYYIWLLRTDLMSKLIH